MDVIDLWWCRCVTVVDAPSFVSQLRSLEKVVDTRPQEAQVGRQPSP